MNSVFREDQELSKCAEIRMELGGENMSNRGWSVGKKKLETQYDSIFREP